MDITTMKVWCAFVILALLIGAHSKFVDDNNPHDQYVNVGDAAVMQCMINDCNAEIEAKFLIPEVNYEARFMPGHNTTDPNLGKLFLWKKCEEGVGILTASLMPRFKSTVMQCIHVEYKKLLKLRQNHQYKVGEDAEQERQRRLHDALVVSYLKPIDIGFSRFAYILVEGEATGWNTLVHAEL